MECPMDKACLFILLSRCVPLVQDAHGLLQKWRVTNDNPSELALSFFVRIRKCHILVMKDDLFKDIPQEHMITQQTHIPLAHLCSQLRVSCSENDHKTNEKVYYGMPQSHR